MKIYDEMLEISDLWKQMEEIAVDEDEALWTEFVSIDSRLWEELYVYYADKTENDSTPRDVFNLMGENIRGFELIKENDRIKGFTFQHGFQYPIIDKDLLGGTGDGKAQVKFEKDYTDRENEKLKELEQQTSIDSPAKESANAKKRAEEKNASRQGLNKNKSKGQRNR